MDIEYAFVLSASDRSDAGALVGDIFLVSTSVTPLLIFDGAREIHEADLTGVVKKRATLDNPSCIVVGVLTPFEATFGDSSSLCAGPSPAVAYLLGCLSARLPKSHVFIVSEEGVGDFWIEHGIQVFSFQNPSWRQDLGSALTAIGIDVNFERIADLNQRGIEP